LGDSGDWGSSAQHPGGEEEQVAGAPPSNVPSLWKAVWQERWQIVDAWLSKWYICRQ